MIGLHNQTPQIDGEIKEEIAKNKIKEVEDQFNLNISQEIDNITYEPNLSYDQGAVAQTRANSNGQIEVAFGDSFFNNPGPDYLQDIRQKRTALHELIHVSDFSNRIDEDLQRLGASQEFIQEWNTNPFYRSTEETEALTEITVDQLLEEDIGSAYPYDKRRKEKELQRKGVDPQIDNSINQADNDLLQEMQELENQIKNAYGIPAETYQEPNTEIYIDSGENYFGITLENSSKEFTEQYSVIMYGDDVGSYLEEMQDQYLQKVTEGELLEETDAISYDRSVSMDENNYSDNKTGITG